MFDKYYNKPLYFYSKKMYQKLILQNQFSIYYFTRISNFTRGKGKLEKIKIRFEFELKFGQGTQRTRSHRYARGTIIHPISFTNAVDRFIISSRFQNWSQTVPLLFRCLLIVMLIMFRDVTRNRRLLFRPLLLLHKCQKQEWRVERAGQSANFIPYPCNFADDACARDASERASKPHSTTTEFNDRLSPVKVFSIEKVENRTKIRSNCVNSARVFFSFFDRLRLFSW